MSMKRMRYVGPVSPVSVMGKGVVKRGDIVGFSEAEVATLNPGNWKAVELESFDKKLRKDEMPKQYVGKKVVVNPRSRRERSKTGTDAFPSNFKKRESD